MTTFTKRSLYRGVLSLLESAAWSASPWRTLHEITESVGAQEVEGAARSAHAWPHERFRQCLEKLDRHGLIKMKNENGTRLYRAAFSPVWSFAQGRARSSVMLPAVALATGAGVLAPR